MKLSEAIRLGAMLRPQAFGGMYVDRPRGILGLTTERRASCAYGAAYEAAGIGPVVRKAEKGELLDGFRGEMTVAVGGEEIYTFSDPWYALSQTVRACPACDKEDALEIMRLIPHLNDVHGWTREQIAEFVEGIEAAQGTIQPASTNAVDPVADDHLVLTPRA